MHIEPLDLTHSKLLKDKLYNMKVRLSEFSFANLYLFRKVHDYKVLTEDECVFITGLTYDKKPFVLPLCEKENPDREKLDEMISIHGMLFPVSEDWLKYFPEDKYIAFHDENDSDYIYTVEKMSTYSGRKLSKKRNLLKQFKELYSYEREKISPENKNKVFEVIDQWQADMSLPPNETDYYSSKEALEHIDDLFLDGYLYYIDGKPAGYVLGEKISEDTYALHFAKGLKEYKGIYQFMYNNLALTLEDNISYINFEQDLGIQSLRQAKSSYKPDHMGEKYRVTFR